MHQITGYTITSLIHNGTRCVVYRGHPNSDAGLSVILKVFKATDDPARITRFEQEYMIARSMRGLDNVAQAIEFVLTDTCCAIVYVDSGISAIPLQVMLERKGSFDQKFFLEISIQLCDALHSVHKQWFIHKDVSPANILVDQHTGVVTLIDFGISEECSPTSLLENSHVGKIEGTLEYISPEQTGRTDVMVDFRSDLYSLGATMYHMLTGKVPFADTQKTSPVVNSASPQLPVTSPTQNRWDYLSIIHAHLARTPPDVARSRKDLHPVISTIVAKLMNKNPRQRYQSAGGLKHDLVRCLEDVTSVAAVARASRRQSVTTLGFELGIQDIGAVLEITDVIRCHHHERDVLVAALERVSWQASEAMIVAGPSGVGKTTLVAGLQDNARRYGLFAIAKWDQYSADIPFGTILACLRSLVTQAQGALPDFQLWARSVGTLLSGPNAQLLLDAIPEVAPLLPKDHAPKSTSALPTKEARDRFVQLLTDLIHIFTEQTVLTLCFDDLQWADSASLELLVSIAVECRHSLFLVWIFRDTELTPDHILTAAVANLKRNMQNLNTLTVSALNELEVIDLVASSLRCTHAEAGPLGRLIHTKTQGNLFFTLHFFKGLYHKSLLWFNWDTNKWCWNTDHIQLMENTDNVIDFLVASLKRTPPYVIAVLHPAACMGHTFNMDIIRRLPSCKTMQPQQIDHALQIALHQGFITHARVSNELALSETTASDKAFRFSHDRVQQAVYNLFPALPTHLEIGHVMLSLAVHQPKPDDIFNIKILSENDLFSAMDHINHSVDIIASSDFDDIERQRICVLNLRAGTIAKGSGAHESALKYINCGISLLPSDCWTGPLYTVALELHLLSAECEYMCDNPEWATAVFETILHFARSDMDKAAAFALRMAVSTANSHFDEAIDAGCRACSLLGWEVEPSAASILAIQMLLEIDKLLCHLAQSSTSSPPSSPSFASLTMPRPPLPTAATTSLSEDPRNVQSYFDSDIIDMPPSPLPTMGGRWAVAKLAFLPEMNNAKAMELMRVLSVMASFTFMTNPAVFAMCACKMVHITLQYGNSPHSCLGFIYFAFYQGTFDNFRTAYEFGMTARALSDRYKLDGVSGASGRTLLCHAGWVAKWGQSFSFCGPQLVQAYHDLLASGDVLCATIAALMKVTHDVWAGEALPILLSEGTRAVEFLIKRCPLKSISLLGTCNVRFAMAMMGLTQSNTSIDDPEITAQNARPTHTSLTGSGQVHFGPTHTIELPRTTTPPPRKNSGPPRPITSTPASPDQADSHTPQIAFSEAAFLESIRTGTGRMRYAHMCWHYVFRLKALYLLECYTEAHAVARDCKQLIHHLSGQTHVILFHFYHALTLVQLIKKSEADAKLREIYMSEIKESCMVLGKWSECAPFNFSHRYHLVRAEVARITGRPEKAQGLYEQAIMACRNSGFVHQEALAVELTSQFFFGRGLAAQGAVLLKQALDKYEQWGATAKVKILKPRYLGFIAPQQLTPSTGQRLLFPPTVHTQPQRKSSTIQLNQSQPRALSLSHSSTADSSKIDVVSVVQASQLVSQEMQLDKMLQKFIHIVMENAGADRVVLLLREGETLGIKAEWDFLKAQYPTILDDPLIILSAEEDAEAVYRFVPKHMVEAVAKTRLPLMVSDPVHSEYGNDPYFTRLNGTSNGGGGGFASTHDVGRQPSSILCCPIHRTAVPGVIGVIFLETSSPISVFSAERLMVLELLCSQMAISFENASLYTSIKSSEHRYRLLTEVMPQLVWIADRTGHLQYSNRRMLEYFGASSVGDMTNFMSTIHADDQALVQALWEKSLRSGEVFNVEARFQGVDKDYKWYLAKALPLTKEGSIVNLNKSKSTEDGLAEQSAGEGRLSRRTSYSEEEAFEIEEWFGTLTDIIYVNEQKLLSLERAHQRAIESSEKRYRLLAEVIPQIVWTATPNGQVDYLNARFYEFSGTKPFHETDPALLSQFLAHLNPAPPPTILSPALSESSSISINSSTSNLRPIPTHSTPQLLHQTPGIPLSHPPARTSSPNISDNLSSTSTSSSLSTASSTSTSSDVTNLSPLSNAGGGWLSVAHPVDHDVVVKEWASALAVEGAFEIECRLRSRTGEYCWHLVRALPVPDAEGRLMKWFGTCTNIEEQKRAEQEHIHAREVAVQTAQIKSAFVANMSHEIRTPLNGILGMVNLLIESELSEDQRENASMIQKCADGLLLIINDVLNFSKLEAGKMELTRINFNLDQVFEGVAEVVIVQASEKKIDMFFAVDPRLPPVLTGDHIKLHQILLNLVGNAIKFTDFGEVLTTCKLIEPTLPHGATSSVPYVVSPGDELELLFEVKDSGCGINLENQKQLFTPFYQADTRTTRKYGGTGLGLAICQQLVRMFGGTINVESNAGRGSTFSFTVKVKAASAVIIEPINAYAKALVVSNNATLRATALPLFATMDILAEDIIASPSALCSTLRASFNIGHYINVVVLDYTNSDDVRELVAAITAEARAAAKIQALVMLVDPVRKKLLANTNMFGSLPVHIVTKPFTRSKLRTLLAQVFQKRSILNSSSTLIHSSQSITILPSRSSPPSLHETSPFSSSPNGNAHPSSRGPTDLRSTPPDSRTKSAPQEPGAPQVCNVMLAEDNAINTKVLVKYLNQMNLNIHTTQNGQEAVELFQKMPLGYFSLILMDCHMPVMDGFQATEEIRRIEMNKVHVPIVSLTANVMPGIVEQCVQAGMDYYLSKPVNFAQLREIIRGILLHK